MTSLERGLVSIHQQLVRAGRLPVFGQPKTAKGKRTVLLPAVAAGVDHRTVADRLGHASPAFTLSTYAHAVAAAQERAAAVANDLLTKTGR